MGWIQNTQIRNAAEAIQDGLQLAKAKAVQLNSQVRFALGASSAWTVGCVTPGANCPATIQSRSTAGSTNAVVTAAQTTIVFDGLGRVIPVPGAGLTFNISNPTGGTCVAAAGTMRCLRVEISTGGGIRMCDPAFSPTGAGGLTLGPQGCLP